MYTLPSGILKRSPAAAITMSFRPARRYATTPFATTPWRLASECRSRRPAFDCGSRFRLPAGVSGPPLGALGCLDAVAAGGRAGCSSDATVAGRAPTAASPASSEKLVVRRRNGALLAHGTGWMSPYQGDRYFEYGVLDRA
jgi:hypothetical protein